MSIYTDIAVECVNSKFDDNEKSLEFGCTESVVKIDSSKKQKIYNKPKGEYYLLDCPNLNSLAPVVYDYIIEQVASYLKCKIKSVTNKEKCKVLVVCLGNENVVSDSLGAQVFDKLITSVHKGEGESSLQAIRTSVLGKTGIDTATLTKSVTTLLNPDVVLLIDSLCSLSINRIGTSIQIADSGIVAGGAIGRQGQLINAPFLRCPTLAIGIPFVVRVETIIADVLNQLSDVQIGDNKTVNAKCKNLLVAPKEIDSMVELGSNLIASAINLAVLDLSVDEQRLIKL
ncbi:MAG: GPR endopeptidase [Christensenellales bacterium]